MRALHFQFDWDKAKAATNVEKHGITFDLASTVFNDSMILTIADMAHSQEEERWFSLGLASNGVVIAVSYLWSELAPDLTKIRIISARRATQSEFRQYGENL